MTRRNRGGYQGSPPERGYPIPKDSEAPRGAKPTGSQPTVGPLGVYVAPKVAEDDKGALAIAISTDPAHGIVRIDFGTKVTWLGLKPKDAMQLAMTLIAHASDLTKSQGAKEDK